MATGLGIDIGSESIKIVQVQVSGHKTTVTRALRIPRKSHHDAPHAHELPPDAPDTGQPAEAAPAFVLPEQLGAEMKKAKMQRSGTVGVSGRDVILKYLSSPPMPPPKLKMYVDMEVGGRLTSSKGAGGDAPAVTYDWRLLNVPSGLSGDLVIMAGVCKNEFLFGTNAMLKRAGLGAERITPSCFGLVNAFLATQTIKPGETVVLVDVGHELLEIAILEEGNLYFARSAPGGGKKFTTGLDRILKLGYDKTVNFKHERARLYPEGAPIPNKQELTFQAALKEGAETIASAIRSSIVFCRTQAKLPKLDYQRIVLSGGGARLAGLREYLEKKTSRTVEILDVSSAIDPRKMDAESAKCFEEEVTDMGVALGLAIIDAKPRSFHFELVPESVLKRRVFMRKTLFAAAAGVVLAVGIIPPYQRASEAATAAEGSLAAIADKREQSLKEKKAFEKLVEKNAVKGAAVEYYARQTRAARVYVELYKAVRAATPQGVNLVYFGAGSDQLARNASVGLGAWSAVDEPAMKFMLRGQYDANLYSGTKWNDEWAKMREKLLQVPGLKDAELDLSTDVEASANPSSKNFQAMVSLQDLSKPLIARMETKK